MSKKRIILTIATCIVAVSVAVAVYMRWQLKQGRSTPPPPGVSVLTDNVALAADLPRGFVVWSSNR